MSHLSNMSRPDKHPSVVPSALATLSALLLTLWGCHNEAPKTTTLPSMTAAVTATASSSNSSAASASPETTRPPGAFSEAALRRHVEHLASPALGGRRAGSADEVAAADYVAAALRTAAVPTARDAFPIGGSGHSLNLRAELRGASAPDEWIVLGAHIDHLGKRGDELYPGAEDNASGVAVVLEMMLRLAKDKARLGRSVMAVFFGAEEVGLVGSRAFVKSPPMPRERIAFMLNIDMIGRPLVDSPGLNMAKMLVGIDGARSLGVVGTSGRAPLRELVDDTLAKFGLRAYGPEDMPSAIRSGIEAYTKGRGDNWPFENVGIPTLFFSSGESADYHRPSDTPDTVYPAIMAQRAAALYELLIALSVAERHQLGWDQPPPVGAP